MNFEGTSRFDERRAKIPASLIPVSSASGAETEQEAKMAAVFQVLTPAVSVKSAHTNTRTRKNRRTRNDKTRNTVTRR